MQEEVAQNELDGPAPRDESVEDGARRVHAREHSFRCGCQAITAASMGRNGRGPDLTLGIVVRDFQAVVASHSNSDLPEQINCWLPLVESAEATRVDSILVG